MQKQTGTIQVKRTFPEMLKGGVICDVVNAEQARIAEEAGSCAVMALERVPADIRAHGGVARMSDPELIIQIKAAVTIPVMAKCRIGHFVEAEILQAIGVDCIDESEVLTPADEHFHVNKHLFSVPFVCGARNLGEALRRIGEGAAMMRTKGEAGSGNVVEAVRHMRAIMDGIRRLQMLPEEEWMTEAKNLGAPYELVAEVARTGKLPVVNFSAGGWSDTAGNGRPGPLGSRYRGARHVSAPGSAAAGAVDCSRCRFDRHGEPPASRAGPGESQSKQKNIWNLKTTTQNYV